MTAGTAATLTFNGEGAPPSCESESEVDVEEAESVSGNVDVDIDTELACISLSITSSELDARELYAAPTAVMPIPDPVREDARVVYTLVVIVTEG